MDLLHSVDSDPDDDMDDSGDDNGPRRIIKTPQQLLQAQNGQVQNLNDIAPESQRTLSCSFGRRVNRRRREGVMQPRSTLTFSEPPQRHICPRQ